MFANAVLDNFSFVIILLRSSFILTFLFLFLKWVQGEREQKESRQVDCESPILFSFLEWMRSVEISSCVTIDWSFIPWNNILRERNSFFSFFLCSPHHLFSWFALLSLVLKRELSWANLSSFFLRSLIYCKLSFALTSLDALSLLFPLISFLQFLCLTGTISHVISAGA